MKHGMKYNHVWNACTFQHLNVSKWSGRGVFLAFLTSKSSSRHNGVQFFISHLPRWLRTRRFSEPTFRPSGATNIGKTQCFATFLPFRVPASSFFWFFFSLIFFLLTFSSLPTSAFPSDLLPSHFLFSSHLCFPPELLPCHFLFSDSSHLCSSICPYCRKFDF